MAKIGSHFRNGTGGEVIPIANITVHPQYNDRARDYDLAIIELASPSKIAPIKVSLKNDSFVQPSKSAWIRGWGSTSGDSATPSPVLLESEVALVGLETCQQIYTSWFIKPTERTICAGEGVCFGDAAAPLTVFKGDTEELVGLASWSRGCGTVGFPAVYTLLASVTDFLQPYLPKPAC